ncbi:MAG TPA: hypothetical protein VFQ35_26315 [Polyangiaceae bacterium]|nr:hypothetical protein [Polyangiaceae bacterium]
MTSRWHNLSLFLGLTVICVSVSCGGRSDRDGSDGGSAGETPSSGGRASVLGGAPSFGGEPAHSGNTGHGGAPASGGAPAYGGAPPAKGGNPGNGGAPASGGSSPGGSPGVGGALSGGATGVGGAMNQCPTFAMQMSQLVEEAKKCNPVLSSEQCTQLIEPGLNCACPTFANPQQKDAIQKLKSVYESYIELGCGMTVVCGPCLEPNRGYCSPQGRCEDVAQAQPLSCKVGGVIYPSGTTQIKDPGGPCNTCSCNDGVLTCTEIGCPSGCPSGTAFGQGCAQCGPADGCLLPEYECYPVCTTTCPDANQFCLNGLCRSGFCG